MKALLIVLGVVTVMCAVLVGPRVYTLATEPGYHPWPSVTRCRMCDDRIYAWQDHERRTYYNHCEYPRPSLGTGDRAVFLGGCSSKSGLVHTDCETNPDADYGDIVPVHTPHRADGYGGFSDTAWDAEAESDEVCDARDNDCGDIPISYEGNDVIIHYKDGDVRLPNWSGGSARNETMWSLSPPSP